MHQVPAQTFENAKTETANMFRDASDIVKNAGKYQIHILSGAHEGATLMLEHGDISIGSARDNTIVLFGDDISEKHVKLELPSSPLKDIKVAPQQEAITLDGRGIVEVGQYVEISSGESFYCGDVEIAVTRFADPKTVGRFSVKVLAVVCLLAIIPLAYGLFSGLAVGVADASSNALSAIQTGISNQKDRLLGAEPTSPKGQLDAFAWTARTKLEDLKLNHRVRVTPTSTGSLRVFGNISDRELPRWTNFLQWYDANPSFPPLIRDIGRESANTSLPKISTVWIDTNPSVVFSDGTVAGIGAQLRDGWKVLAIEKGAVTIGRDGSVISLTY